TSRFSRPVPAIPPSPAFSPLHPFPTRRSSDLAARASRDSSTATARRRPHPSARGAPSSPTADRGTAVRTPPRPAGHIGRSSYTRLMTSQANVTVLPPSLVELVTTHVRSEVLSGALEPGERIVEETLCARLGVSRAPVREALRLLAQEGLVEHLPRRGFRVVVWSATDILQLFELRRVLERHAIESALPLPAEGDPFAPVRAALDDMRRADTRDDPLERDNAHRRFHLAVVALAGNHQLN